MELEDYKRLVFADIPGLIEGAHSGSGLGNTFLRHIERTRVIVHLIDISATDPLETYRLVRKELTLFSSKLSEKAEIIVLNKADILDVETGLNIAEDLSRKLSKPVYTISAVTGKNVKDIIKKAAGLVDKENQEKHSCTPARHCLSDGSDEMGKLLSY